MEGVSFVSFASFADTVLRQQIAQMRWETENHHVVCGI
jgi:hypothetical protein